MDGGRESLAGRTFQLRNAFNDNVEGGTEHWSTYASPLNVIIISSRARLIPANSIWP